MDVGGHVVEDFGNVLKDELLFRFGDGAVTGYEMKNEMLAAIGGGIIVVEEWFAYFIFCDEEELFQSNFWERNRQFGVNFFFVEMKVFNFYGSVFLNGNKGTVIQLANQKSMENVGITKRGFLFIPFSKRN